LRETKQMLAAHVLFAVLLLAVALYAQRRVVSYTAGRQNVVLTRAVLAVVGVLAGARHEGRS
jgi:hypothetical protein